jgi:acyl-CoA synthetase (AMP-forming)/AMP-acid ligase II
MPGIEQAVTIVYKNNSDQNELVCYYSGADVSVDALRDHIKDQLNEGVRPAYLIKMDTLPLNLNGKVDRSALPRRKYGVKS